MARWRGKKRQQQMLGALIFGTIVFISLGWLASKIPWDSVLFGAFAIIMASFSVFALYQLFRVGRFHFDSEGARAKRFKVASAARGRTHMTSLSPTEFEHYVGTIYENLDYTVSVTRQSGDQGIDLILEDEGGTTTGVQVKRYQSSRVGVPELQLLVGACSKKYDKMLFVTSSDYSSTARDYAAEQGIVLVDGESLTAMAEKVFGDGYQRKTLAWKIFRKMENLV